MELWQVHQDSAWKNSTSEGMTWSQHWQTRYMRAYSFCRSFEMVSWGKSYKLGRADWAQLLKAPLSISSSISSNLIAGEEHVLSLV
jgi:hypothetical protein